MEWFKNKVEENGIYYYIIPANFGLFKATKTYDKSQSGLKLDPSRNYFFGIKNMSPEYIEEYERLYGIIFEFVTTREYKLLALDEKSTKEMIYKSSPEVIQHILQHNYGHMTGIRHSESDNDSELSKYLCEKGYDGYGIHDMKTDFEGTFHDELMICNMDGIHYLGKVTTDDKMLQIIEKTKFDELSKNLKQTRKKRFLNEDSPVSKKVMLSSSFSPPPLSFTKRLFDDDDDESSDEDEDERRVSRSLFGGIKPKRKVTRKRKGMTKRKVTHKGKVTHKHKGMSKRKVTDKGKVIDKK